jgi:uncharacterized membrane protein YsdA (DUF1294 family)
MWIYVAAWYGGMSAITLVAYGWDKLRAIRGWRRTPERTLHLLALAGGWPGALVGQQLFRHKRHKRPFLIVTAGIVLVHALGWAAWMWTRGQNWA